MCISCATGSLRWNRASLFRDLDLMIDIERIKYVIWAYNRRSAAYI